MLGVDKIDQMMSYYSFVRKSIKWWRKVFFWLLDMSVVNSFIIYRHIISGRSNTQLQEAHLNFRRSIIDDLVKPLVTISPPPRITNTLQRLNSRPHFPKKMTKRRDCVVCSDRDIQRHLTQFICETCEDQPALCPDNCFKRYHIIVHY